MKTAHIILTLVLCSLLGACTTYVDQNGQQRTGLSRTGASLLQAGISTGIGVASGALMNNQPGWATGGVAGLSGNVAAQAVNALVPVAPPPNSRNQGPQYTGVDYGNDGNKYVSVGDGVYKQLPNGDLMRVQ